MGTHLEDHGRLLAVFESLPPQWRNVLWYVDVLQESHARAGLRMGIHVDDVAALVSCAHAGLREAYAIAVTET